MRYNKIKVGRVSGYPVVVRTGKSEHEAILIDPACDYKNPEIFLDIKSGFGNERPQNVNIRWSVAGYDDSVPAKSVRLKPLDQGGRTTRGGGGGVADEASGVKSATQRNKKGEVGGGKKRKAGRAEEKPVMAMSESTNDSDHQSLSHSCQ